jgi:hypothetical protein
MAVTRADLSFVKSVTVVDTSANGGKMGSIAVQNRVKYNLFPRVTRPERVSGVTRYRKEFLWNKNVSDDIAYGLLIYPIYPSPGDDRFRLALGTQTDIQSDIDSDYDWYGVGALHTSLSPSGTTVVIDFEDEDVAINNGVLLAISSHFRLSQTLDTLVVPFNQVYWDGAKWIAQNAPTVDAEDVYPYGTCLSKSGGTGTVFTYSTSSYIEYHRILNTTHDDDLTPTPDGIEDDFTVTIGADYRPVNPGSVTVAYTIGTTEYEATDNGDGAITGTGITSGSIVYTTGVVEITFSSPLADGSDAIVTSAKKQYSWSTHTCTVELEDAILNAFSNTNTFVGMCIEPGDIQSSITNVVKTFAGSGTFDESKVTGTNKGTIEETWTLLFTSGTAFQCTGAVKGVIGSGTTSGTYAPNNPDQSTAYFTLLSTAWGGTPQSGDTVMFTTHPASVPIWWKEIVPAGANPISNNVAMLEIYVE